MKLQAVFNAAKEHAVPAGGAPAAAAAAPAAAAPAGGGLKSAPLFEAIGAAVKTQGAALVKQVGGVIEFNVDKAVWTIDLKNGAGSVKAEKAAKPDIVITMSDDVFVQLADGKLNAQQAFMQGKIKVRPSCVRGGGGRRHAHGGVMRPLARGRR